MPFLYFSLMSSRFFRSADLDDLAKALNDPTDT
jgi:hypothetical protein